MEKKKVEVKRRREYAREFKSEAVNLVKFQNMNISEVARNLGIDGNILRRWVRETNNGSSDNVFPGKGNLPESQARVGELEKQVRRLTMERDILKKAMAFFVEIPK